MNPNKNLGANIRELRKQQNISQEVLAELANLHRTYISAVERGRTNVTYRTLRKIAHGLGITVAELTSGVNANDFRISHGAPRE